MNGNFHPVPHPPIGIEIFIPSIFLLIWWLSLARYFWLLREESISYLLPKVLLNTDCWFFWNISRLQQIIENSIETFEYILFNLLLEVHSKYLLLSFVSVLNIEWSWHSLYKMILPKRWSPTCLVPDIEIKIKITLYYNEEVGSNLNKSEWVTWNRYLPPVECSGCRWCWRPSRRDRLQSAHDRRPRSASR